MNTTVYDDTYIAERDGVLQLGTGDNGLFFVTWMICPSDVDIEDGIILKKGTYAMFASSGDVAIYTASLTIPGYTGFPMTKKIEEKYLPDRGPIYLYADAEYYLYATEDTSDINKRVTCQQFESFIDSGRLVMLKYVDSNGRIDCFCPLMLNISSNGVGEFVSSAGPKFHTAEYVAE